MPFDANDKAFFKTAPGKGEGNRGIFIGPVNSSKGSTGEKSFCGVQIHRIIE